MLCRLFIRKLCRKPAESDPRCGPITSVESSSRLGMLAMDYADYVHRDGIPDSADMSAWEAVANRKIRQGMKQGEFSGLKGSGKPLQDIGWSSRMSDTTLGDKILRNANMKPQWAQIKESVEEKVVLFRGQLRERGGDVNTKEAEEQLASINRAIEDFNLLVPSHIHIPKLNLHREIRIAREQ